MKRLGETRERTKPWKLVLTGMFAAWAIAGCGAEGDDGDKSTDATWQTLSANAAQVKYFTVPIRPEPAPAGKVLSLAADVDVAISDSGRVAVAWGTGIRDPLDRSSSSPPAPAIHASDVHLQMFDEQANPAGPAHIVGSIEPGAALNITPRVAMSPAGEAFYVWWQQKYNDEQLEAYDERARSWLMSRRYAANGQPMGAASVLVNRNNAGLGRFRTFLAVDGTLQLGFSFGSRLHETEQFMRQLFNSNGQPLGPMSATTRFGASPDALGPGGTYAAVADWLWGDKSGPELSNTLKWYTAQGEVAAEGTIKGGFITSVVYGHNGTMYAAASHPDAQNNHVEGRIHRFSADGKHLGQVSLGSAGSMNSRTHSGVTLAQGSDGRLVAAWQNLEPATPGIRAQALSEECEKIGDEMRVDEFHPEYQYFSGAVGLKPRLVMGANGRFTVVYVIFKQDNTMLVGGSVVQL